MQAVLLGYVESRYFSHLRKLGLSINAKADVSGGTRGLHYVGVSIVYTINEVAAESALLHKLARASVARKCDCSRHVMARLWVIVKKTYPVGVRFKLIEIN